MKQFIIENVWYCSTCKQEKKDAITSNQTPSPTPSLKNIMSLSIVLHFNCGNRHAIPETLVSHDLWLQT